MAMTPGTEGLLLQRLESYRQAWVAEIKLREAAEAKLRKIRKLAKAAA